MVQVGRIDVPVPVVRLVDFEVCSVVLDPTLQQRQHLRPRRQTQQLPRFSFEVTQCATECPSGGVTVDQHVVCVGIQT